MSRESEPTDAAFDESATFVRVGHSITRKWTADCACGPIVPSIGFAAVKYLVAVKQTC